MPNHSSSILDLHATAQELMHYRSIVSLAHRQRKNFKTLRIREKATWQQAAFSSRENSSNGG